MNFVIIHTLNTVTDHSLEIIHRHENENR